MRIVTYLTVTAIFLTLHCSNGTQSDASNTSSANSGATATAKGCTSAQVAFRIKNSTASSRDCAIDTGATCAGTTTNSNPLTLSTGATGNYVCANAGTYYGRTLTAGGGTESCSSSAFSMNANGVYTITITNISGSVMTAASSQD